MTQDTDKDWLRGGWMQTYTGRKFYPADPQPDMIDIRDIAHALSHVARFAGHTDEFFSVGQHSYMMSLRFVDPKLSLEALLHDATEAYLGDVPSPLKALLPDYKVLEKKLDAVIREKFGLPPEMSPTVKDRDVEALFWELHYLMGPAPADVKLAPVMGGHASLDIPNWKPKKIEEMFLKRYRDLRGRI